VPAVQYLGAKGFFTTYWARPNDPLTMGLAGGWISAAGDLAQGKKMDPTMRAREMHALDRATSDAITAADFARRLDAALRTTKRTAPSATELLRSLGVTPDDSISRAKACELIFAAIAPLDLPESSKP
jgi:hypothetical protein